MTESISTHSTGNALLDALPESDWKQIQPIISTVELKAQQTLSMQGELVEPVYFPTTGMVSCRASGSHGELVEVYAVGREGVVEAAAVLTGVAAIPAEVQIGGQAYRIKIDDLCHLLGATKE
jgi:hypothetical protein